MSKTSTPRSAATAATKSGRAATPETSPTRTRAEPVQPHERTHVHELDECGDDHRGERRLGKLLEQPGQEEQRHDRQPGHDEARIPVTSRPAEPLTAVFERLPFTTMPLERPEADVGRAEAEKLAVGVDLVVVLDGVRLGGTEALREADRA